jgi:hypothetical protein
LSCSAALHALVVALLRTLPVRHTHVTLLLRETPQCCLMVMPHHHGYALVILLFKQTDEMQ